MARKIEIVGVIGAGTMGRGIAQVAATAGCTVYLLDKNEASLEITKASYSKVFTRLVEKEVYTQEQADKILERISYGSDLSILKNADLIIEAVIEDVAIKQALFKEVEGLVSTDAVIASNTSSISVTSLAAVLQKPERSIGLHFFNPAPLLPLVEVVPGLSTEVSLVDEMKALMKQWKKVPAVAKDTPGFIVNRIARPFYGESLRIVEEGIASPLQLDTALKQQGGFKMGPFELMDLIGNDINLTVTRTVFEAFHYDSRYTPSLLQQRMVEAGRLGRKSGCGYFNYSQEAHTSKEEALSEQQQKALLLRVLVMLINEAVDALYYGIAKVEDIEHAMVKGVSYPKGLLAWGDELGPEFVLRCLDTLYQRYKEQRYRPHPLLVERVHDQRPLAEDIDSVHTGLESLLS